MSIEVTTRVACMFLKQYLLEPCAPLLRPLNYSISADKEQTNILS